MDFLVLAAVGLLLGAAWMVAMSGKRFYNIIVARDIEVIQFLSNINIKLRQRNDMVKQLIAVVKDFAVFEPKILQEIVRLRSGGKTGAAVPEETSEGDLFRAIMVVVENYPTLKTSDQFMYLAKAIRTMESEIAGMRIDYNDKVSQFNRIVRQFPSSWVARHYGYKVKEVLQADNKFETTPDIKLLVQ